MGRIRKEAHEGYMEKIKEYEEEIERLENEINRLNKEINKVNSQIIPDYKKEINEYKNEIEQLYSEIEDLGSMEKQLSENSKIIAEKNYEIDEIKSKYKELKKKSKNITYESDKYMDLLMNIAATAFDIEDPTLYSYKELLNKISFKYSDQKDKIKGLKYEIDYIKELIENLQEKSKRMIEDAQLLIKQNNELLHEKEVLLDPHSPERLKSQLLDSQNEIQHITESYKKSVKELKKQQEKCQNMYKKIVFLSLLIVKCFT